jgi:formate dehydrogenase (coenzyme F420) beta subunit
MRGKRVSRETVENGLNRFLEDGRHLVMGFRKDAEGASIHVFRDRAEGLTLFNPVFSTNGALYLRRLFGKGNRIVLVLRPCEVRACVELVKLAQVEREDIVAVSVDCFGAVSAKGQTEDLPAEAEGLGAYFDGLADGRPACVACREKRGAVGDAGIRIGKDGTLWAVPYTEQGEAFLALFDNEAEETDDAMLLDGPAAKKEPFRTSMADFSKDFARCILCRNCRAMCPVCYCIDCLFNGDDYLPKGDALFNKIFRAGGIDLPQGKELFHLIRMFHVSQSCVGCGACEEACPQSIPLTRYFKGTSERLQDLFSYMSGRSGSETMPYVTFLEDELKDAED